MELDKILIGNRIRNIRKEKLLSMEKFAELIGASGKSTVNEWEKGRSIPNPDFLEKIAKIGKVSEDFILFGNLDEYVRKILFNELDKHDSFFNSVKEYAYLTTDLSDFETAPFIYDDKGKIVDPDDMDNFILEALKSVLCEIVDEKISKIVLKIKTLSLSYRDDSAIVDVATSFFLEEAFIHSFNFEGYYRLLKKALNETPTPLTIGIGDFSNENIIKTLKELGYSDSEIIEKQFEARLSKLKIEFSKNISNLYDEYVKFKQEKNKNQH